MLAPSDSVSRMMHVHFSPLAHVRSLPPLRLRRGRRRKAMPGSYSSTCRRASGPTSGFSSPGGVRHDEPRPDPGGEAFQPSVHSRCHSGGSLCRQLCSTWRDSHVVAPSLFLSDLRLGVSICSCISPDSLLWDTLPGHALRCGRHGSKVP